MQSVSYQPSAHLDSNTATGGLLGEETEIQMRQLPFKNEIGEIQLKIQIQLTVYWEKKLKYKLDGFLSKMKKGEIQLTL